jgi:hypothetical protein
MRLSNISDITPGDIIITSNNQSGTHTYDTVDSPYTAYVATGNNGTDTATIQRLYGTGAGYILSVDNGAYILTSLSDGRILIVNNVWHYTMRDALFNNTLHRLDAIEKLSHFFSKYSSDIHEVRTIMDEARRNWEQYINIDDMQGSYERLTALIDRVERTTKNRVSDMQVRLNEVHSILNETANRMCDTMEAVKHVTVPTEWVNITWKALGYNYSNRYDNQPIPVNAGITLRWGGNEYLNFFVNRATTTRAHVTNLNTGEEVGYIAANATEGLYLLYKNDPKKKHRIYQVMPISAGTIEDTKAYVERNNKLLALFNQCVESVGAKFKQIDIESINRVAGNPLKLDTTEYHRYSMVTPNEALTNIICDMKRVENRKGVLEERTSEWLSEFRQATTEALTNL